MTWKTEGNKLTWIVLIFALFYFVPMDAPRLSAAVREALILAGWYAREHVLTCLVPAFFIAGAIAVFVSKASVMRYLGAGAPKAVAYAVASVSGSILAVCSCTVLPLFAGIYRMGAGLGPASAFLYSGPAINVLAIILTARILGFELGIARAVGAVVFAVVIGLLMHLIFRREEEEKAVAQAALPVPEDERPLYQTIIYFALMIAVLVFANWGSPGEGAAGFWVFMHQSKWYLTSAAALLLAVVLVIWYKLPWWKMLIAVVPAVVLGLIYPAVPVLAMTAAVIGLAAATLSEQAEMKEWTVESWTLAKQIMPLLFFGVLAAGLLLGSPGSEGLIPKDWVAAAVGGNSFGANLFAAFAGAFMYFATLTEVPILQGLLDSGMGQGPALALLLAGPALSLPNMLVIASVMGWKKTGVFVALVVAMATISGLIFGALYG